MKLRFASIVAGAIFSGVTGLSSAQIEAPLQPGPPSVQPLQRPAAGAANPLPGGPLLLPGSAQPVQSAYPQLQIRFGKIPPLSASASQAARSADIAARNTVEDAAARCEAEITEPARGACRERVAKTERGQPAASPASASAL